MKYEVWDGDSGNRLGEYETEAEASAVIEHTVKMFGTDSRELRSLGLLRIDETGQGELLGEGKSLLALIETARV